MSTVWQQVEARGIFAIPGLPGVTRGVVRAYCNMENVSVPVVTVTGPPSKGADRRDCADEILHELNPNPPCQLPQS